MMANHLHRGAAAAALGALLAWHTPAHQISALPFFGSEGDDTVKDAVAHVGSAVRDASAAAPSVGGGFFGGREGQGASFQPSSYNKIPPEAMAANVGDLLQNAVLSATSAAGGAAEAVMDTASHGLEEAKRKAAQLYEAGTQHPAASVANAARRASHGAASAASGVASQAKRQFNALGSLLKEKAPGAAGAAYHTAKTAGSAAGKAAEDLAEKTGEAKSAFLNWAQMMRDEMEKRAASNRLGSQVATTASDTAEAARHAAIAAAEKASAAAKEARKTLSGVGEDVQSRSQGAAGSAMQAARTASERARSAYDTLEDAALTARTALDSWGTMIGSTLHAGTNKAREAAHAATETAKHLAEKLGGAASNATRAAETLQDTAGLFSYIPEGAANRADQVVEGMTADVSKTLRDFLPWGETKDMTEAGLQHLVDNSKGLGDKAKDVIQHQTENLKQKAGEACGCGSSMTGKLISGACYCLSGGNRWSLWGAAKNLFGFGQKVKNTTDDIADTAANTSQGLIHKVESAIGGTGKKLLSSMNKNPPTAELRPTDGAAWLGGLIGGNPMTEDNSEGTAGVRETLPPVYREGIPLDCDPLPPYKDCIAQCDAEDARDAALAQQGLDSPRGLGSYDYSKKRGCYLACKSKWVDTTLPGCIDTSGKVVAGTPPAAQYRTSTSTAATRTESDDDEQNESPGSSWGSFMKRLHNEGQDAAHEVKEKLTPSTGVFSWLFSRESPMTTTTTTTTMPPTRSGFFGSLFGRKTPVEDEAENSGWMKGLRWGGLKHSITSRTPAEETGLKETLTSTDRIETTATNGFLMWCAVVVLLLALAFVVMVLKRWEAHHRERRTTDRPQVVTQTEAEMERPLMH